MANHSTPIKDELIDAVLSYDFSNSPFELKITKEQLFKIKAKQFVDILEQIWRKISDHIISKHDAEVFRLIKRCISVTCKEISDFIEKSPYELLLTSKTFRTSIIERKATERVHDFYRAFFKIVESEIEENKSMNRVKGCYNIFNLHNTNGKKFQGSNLFISLNDKGSFINYYTRRYKIETKNIKVEIVGNDKLLITLREDDCVLIFYGFIGRLRNPKIIQAIFLYNNGLGYTISSLAILQRVDNKQFFVEPKREEVDLSWVHSKILSDEDKKRVQYFLVNKGKVVKPKFFSNNQGGQSMKFDMGDLEVFPGPNSKDAYYYKDTEQYVGEYNIFFNERFPSKEIGDIKFNEYYSTVGKGVFKIYQDFNDGSFRCKMKTRKNRHEEIIEHEGYILNDELKSPSYLIISMYEKNYKHRYINIILMKTGGDILLGSHNIMYSRVGQLGVGSVVVIKNKEEDSYSNMSPDFGFPINTGKQRLYDAIKNYLSCNSNALLAPITDTSKLREFTNLRYSGLYKVYSYLEDGVRVGFLKIDKTGFVTHLGISGEKITKAYGYTDLVRSVLNILLKDIENNRTGFFSIKVAEVAPTTGNSGNTTNSSKDNKTIYVGTFSGVTRRDGEFPVATTIILEFMDDNPDLDIDQYLPQVLTSESQEYSKIPAEIKKTLEMKHKSFIGFYEKRRGIFKMSDLDEFNKVTQSDKEIFYDSLAADIADNTLKDINGISVKDKESISLHLYERGLYHALIKVDHEAATNLFKKSIRISRTPTKLKQELKTALKNSSCKDMIFDALEV